MVSFVICKAKRNKVIMLIKKMYKTCNVISDYKNNFINIKYQHTNDMHPFKKNL